MEMKSILKYSSEFGDCCMFQRKLRCGFRKDDQEDTLSIADPIDTDIEKHPGYHGTISANKAESRLKKEGKNCHLTRYSQKKKMYILSVCWEGTVKHFQVRVNYQRNLYEIEGTQRPYEDFYTLLNFYREYPVDHDVGGIGYYLEIDDKKACLISTLKRKKKDPVQIMTKNHIPVNDDREQEETQAQRSFSRTLSRRDIPQFILAGVNSHPSFHGSMRDSDAESKLKRHERNCYLTRYSRFRSKLRISVQRKKGSKFIIEHFNLSIKVINDESRYEFEIEGTQKKIFDDINYLLIYYQNQPINNNVDGIGQCLEATENIDSHRTLIGAPLHPRQPQPVPLEYGKNMHSDLTPVFRPLQIVPKMRPPF